MKVALILFVLLVFAACSTPRVIVKDCQDLKGKNGEKNCELIKEL